VTLDGGERGGNRGLSADAATFYLRVLLGLAACGSRLDLVRYRYRFTAWFHRESVRNLPRKCLGKLSFVVCVDLYSVTAPRYCHIR